MPYCKHCRQYVSAYMPSHDCPEKGSIKKEDYVSELVSELAEVAIVGAVSSFLGGLFSSGDSGTSGNGGSGNDSDFEFGGGKSGGGGAEGDW